ncbi:AcrR family transcriptional regulator [Nocardia sp. GAS34]|uniref:TetR/AcrR family transcriptional regulator n=1 Tax=unclassified Nocardia TaxID=2637762 RepID=UPI003D245288
MPTQRQYHHGDLRRALLDAAVTAIDERGPGAVSLRELARAVGVSHAAPVHHFGDKAGLLTAVAAEGFQLLGDDLAAVRARGGDIVEMGVAYVRFAIGHRAHFEVMFSADLHRAGDPILDRAGERAFAQLTEGVAGSDPVSPPDNSAVVAAWSLVHGFATLWNMGALPSELAEDPEAMARSIAQRLDTKSG